MIKLGTFYIQGFRNGFHLFTRKNVYLIRLPYWLLRVLYKLTGG